MTGRTLKFRLEYDPYFREGAYFSSAEDKKLQGTLASDESFQRRFQSLYKRFCEIVTAVEEAELEEQT